MPATRTTCTRTHANRPICPLSSPTLPVTPLLPGRKASKEQAKANRIDVDKELKRATWNAEIGRDDYEEEFGQYCPDAEAADFHQAKAEAISTVTKLSEKAVYSCPFNDFETLRDFLDAVKILSLDFNITWKFGTHQDDIMADKAKLLDEVEELLHRTNGEAHLMDEQAGKRFQFSVRNPFAKNDLQCIEFDRFLRQHLRDFRRNVSDLQPTVMDDKFRFNIPNPYANDKGTDTEAYLFWCCRRIWRAEIIAACWKAKVKAMQPALPAPIPAAVFYVH
ncbi:hypothetical protein B0H16DRAFT_1480148 [Mycena metata]|uniref:Uncharacterized protein n=1 Tax=Mycena metata TaxID=1033252 RepID=A0AAD7MD83_9AGAR|nr:hypothetical protein B0H16DRAFT_1480148 [Mycena metata]